jgi:hypothetical protein
MSTNLDRSADALLQQKALQTTHHERLAADAQQASRTLRVTYQNTRNSVAEVRRLREDLRDVREETAQLEKAFESQHQLRLSMLSALRAKGVDEADSALQQLESVGMRWAGVPVRLGKVDAQLDAYHLAQCRVSDCISTANDAQSAVAAAVNFHNVHFAAEEVRRVLYHTHSRGSDAFPPSETSCTNGVDEAMRPPPAVPVLLKVLEWEATVGKDTRNLAALLQANTHRIAELESMIAEHVASTDAVNIMTVTMTDRLQNIVTPDIAAKSLSLAVHEDAVRSLDAAIPLLATTLLRNTKIAAPMLDAFISDALEIASEATALPADVRAAASEHGKRAALRRVQNQELKEALAASMADEASMLFTIESLSAGVTEGRALLTPAEEAWSRITKELHDLTAQKSTLHDANQSHRAAMEGLHQKIDDARQRRMETMINIQAEIATLLMEFVPSARKSIESEEEAAFIELSEWQLGDVSATIEQAAMRQQQETMKALQIQQEQQRERELQQQLRRRQEFEEMRKATLVDVTNDDNGATVLAGHAAPPPSGRPTLPHQIVEASAAAMDASRIGTKPLIQKPVDLPSPHGVVVVKTSGTAAAAAAAAPFIKKGPLLKSHQPQHQSQQQPSGKRPVAAASSIAVAVGSSNNKGRAPSPAFSAWSAADVHLGSLMPPTPSANATVTDPRPAATLKATVNNANNSTSGNGGAKMVGRHQAQHQQQQTQPGSSQRSAAATAAPALVVFESPSPQPRQPAARRTLPAGGQPVGKVVQPQAVPNSQASHTASAANRAPKPLTTSGTSLAAALRRPTMPASQQQRLFSAAATATKERVDSTHKKPSDDNDEFDVFAL